MEFPKIGSSAKPKLHDVNHFALEARGNPVEGLIHVFLIYLQLAHQNAICMRGAKVSWAFISWSLARMRMRVGLKFCQGKHNCQGLSYLQNQDSGNFEELF